jgi:hypothetical protein
VGKGIQTKSQNLQVWKNVLSQAGMSPRVRRIQCFCMRAKLWSTSGENPSPTNPLLSRGRPSLKYFLDTLGSQEGTTYLEWRILSLLIASDNRGKVTNSGP